MKIVAAVDGSDHSTRALEFAAKLAASFRAELVIVTVSQRMVDEELRRFGRIESATIGDILEQEAAALLLAAKTRAEALGAARISTAAEEGDPAAALLEHTRGTDALVIGRRGRGRLAGLLLGSVSQKLAALSPVPVTIVP
ncbi:MAG TPA: universal stress protein [Rhizomicrobium sp.]|nr:universal stress protein [Rhizomicrobium sp.]